MARPAVTRRAFSFTGPPGSRAPKGKIGSLPWHRAAAPCLPQVPRLPRFSVRCTRREPVLKLIAIPANDATKADRTWNSPFSQQGPNVSNRDAEELSDFAYRHGQATAFIRMRVSAHARILRTSDCAAIAQSLHFDCALEKETVMAFLSLDSSGQVPIAALL